MPKVSIIMENYGKSLPRISIIMETRSIIMENKGIIMEKFPQLWKLTPQLWRIFHNCGNYHHNYCRGFGISGKSLPRISIIMETFVTLYHNYGR